MRAYIANTDFEWYQFLLARPDLDEVNFWRPGTANFHALAPGAPLLFRLKAPHDAIAGVGFFVHFSLLPVSVAWATFEKKNGVDSEQEMRHRIEKYRQRLRTPIERGEDYKIGCIVLTEPVFLSREEWVAQPNDWHSNTVAGRGEDLAFGEGARLWRELMDRLRSSRIRASEAVARYGAEQTIRPRLGLSRPLLNLRTE